MVTNITVDNFEAEVLRAEGKVLVDFWAEWCGPCKRVAPIVDELAEEYADKVLIGKYNVDDYSDLSTEYSIRNIPTMLFFKGGELKERNVGSISKADLAKKIDALL